MAKTQKLKVLLPSGLEREITFKREPKRDFYSGGKKIKVWVPVEKSSIG